jgi:hypothetical protein
MGSRKKRWLAIPPIFEAFLSEEFQPAIPARIFYRGLLG